MVSRARVTDRRALPRDEHVTRGLQDAQNASHRPYLYKLKVKSGRGRTKNVETVAYTRLHAFANMITEHAEEGQDFFAYNVSRVLRYQSKVRDY